jgi:glycosyltransferase involved in cell wall biosynthesis
VRVAFVHDYLTQYGGAERVLFEMRRLYPHAPLFTSLYDPHAFEGRLAGVDVRTSFLQKLPGATRRFRELLPLYPRAFESLDLRDYELVISSTTSFAKGVFVGPRTLHISYINTPTRFLWYPQEYAPRLVPPMLRPVLAMFEPSLRRWDLEAAQRPNVLVANSRNVARRIHEVYGRHSEVVHCPVDAAGFEGEVSDGDYYLVMSRLLPYKRVDLAVEACSALGTRLIVAGSGPQEEQLRARAASCVHFAGQVDDEHRVQLIGGARAIIVPGVEDFGLVALEAAAAGRPVVAFAAGGSLETVVEGETGLFFSEPTAQALAHSLQRLPAVTWDRERLRAHARRFAPDEFRTRLAALIERSLEDFRRRQAS